MAQMSFCMSCDLGVACSASMLLQYSVAAVLIAWISLGSRLSPLFRICLDTECLSCTQSRLPAKK